MGTPEPLELVAFDSDDHPLAELRASSHGQYLRSYLADLDAKSVLVEPVTGCAERLLVKNP